jgi:hypothetical protein
MIGTLIDFDGAQMACAGTRGATNFLCCVEGMEGRWKVYRLREPFWA